MILGHRKFKYSLVFTTKLKQIGLKVKYEDFSHLWLVVLDASSQKNEGCLIVQCSSILRNVLGIHPSKQGDNGKKKNLPELRGEEGTKYPSAVQKELLH